MRDEFIDGSPSQRLYALQDANWNVVAVCNISGEVQEHFNYTAYGVCTVLSPEFIVLSGSAYDWTVLYTGRELDWATGLYYYREELRGPVRHIHH